MGKSTKVLVRGKTSWVINIGKVGKRSRKFFDTLIQAKKFDEYSWVHEKYRPAFAVTFLFFSGGIKVLPQQLGTKYI